MIARWLSYFSFACFGILTLVALYMTRRPLCIDSKIVEKIDRLGIHSTDTVYRCAVNKNVPFSAYFNENARNFSQRISTVERYLESLSPFERKVQVTIFEDRPYLFKVQDHQIYIGQTLLETPGHLEKALAKVWYREKADGLFVNQDLLEEVVTDFLVYGATGSLDIRDPITQQHPQITSVKWPYVIKSAQGYCDSPWKFSEHIATCAAQAANYQPGDEGSPFKEVATEYSLRSLLSSTWINAYKDLGLMEQGRFLKSFADLLSEDHTPELPITRSSAIGANNSPLMEAAETIKNVNSFVSTSHLMRDSSSYRSFLVSLTKSLRAAGYSDAFAEAYFDVVFISDQPLSEKSKIYSQFKEIAQSNPHLHIALKDAENIWLLPARYPVPLKSFGQMRTNRAIVEHCGQFNFNYVLGYSNFAEKLLVVDSCDRAQESKYSRFITDGAEGFAQQNKGIPFIQFHIPSILMKRNQLASVPSVYELVQKREIDNPVFQSLGWQELHWSESAKAYRPKAFVDAIEWFRAPEAKKDN